MGLTIGCIEDHEPDFVLIQGALRTGPVEIDSLLRAHDLLGLEQMLGTHQLDVVVLDLDLPDSQGIEAVVRARQLVGSVPIVVLAGEGEGGLAAISAGADDFLNKDLIGGGQLVRVITFAVERRKPIIDASTDKAGDGASGFDNADDIEISIAPQVDVVAGRSPSTAQEEAP